MAGARFAALVAMWRSSAVQHWLHAPDRHFAADPAGIAKACRRACQKEVAAKEGRPCYFAVACSLRTLAGCIAALLRRAAANQTSDCAQVITVEDGNTDVDAIRKAIDEAKKCTDKPTMIKISTLIGYGSPNKVNSYAAHGAPLGADETKLTREQLKWEYGEFEVRRFSCACTLLCDTSQRRMSL